MNYSNFDDQSLLRLISQKDQDALAELYDRFSRLVYSIALNALGDLALAEEITQDVFFRVWKKSSSYRPDQAKVVTWIAGIARNRSIDEIRRLKIRIEASQSPWQPEDLDITAEAQDVEDHVERSQQKIRVQRAISTLPEEQRRVLSLAYFQGYTHKEIAEILNEPLGTVKTRIHLGMKKLRDELSGDSFT